MNWGFVRQQQDKDTMNIRELGEAARKLKVKAVLQGDGEQDSLNMAWNDLEVVYIHARRVLGGGFSLVGARKDWRSIQKYAHVVMRECERLHDDDNELVGK
jgi:hypothetical protein